MTVLVTMMKNSMTRSAGYITLNELEFIDSYTFSKCIKVKNVKKPQDINKLVIFYEDTNIVAMFDVMCSNIITGELRVTMYNKKVLFDGSLGEYKCPANKSHYFTEFYNDTLMAPTEIADYFRKNLINTVNDSADAFSTPGVTMQPAPKNTKKDKRSSTSLNEMTPERLLELKKKIFGDGYTEDK